MGNRNMNLTDSDLLLAKRIRTLAKDWTEGRLSPEAEEELLSFAREEKRASWRGHLDDSTVAVLKAVAAFDTYASESLSASAATIPTSLERRLEKHIHALANGQSTERERKVYFRRNTLWKYASAAAVAAILATGGWNLWHRTPELRLNPGSDTIASTGIYNDTIKKEGYSLATPDTREHLNGTGDATEPITPGVTAEVKKNEEKKRETSYRPRHKESIKKTGNVDSRSSQPDETVQLLPTHQEPTGEDIMLASVTQEEINNSAIILNESVGRAINRTAGAESKLVKNLVEVCQIIDQIEGSLSFARSSVESVFASTNPTPVFSNFEITSMPTDPTSF